MGVKRQPIFVLIAGTNGTGKSSLIRNHFIKPYNKKILIVDPDGMEEIWQEFPLIDSMDIEYPPYKITRVMMEHEVETIEALKTFSNGMLILDDCRVYVSSRLEKPFRSLFIRRKQLCQDQIAVAHGISEIPATFWTYATHLILFKTTDSYLRQSSKDNIPRSKVDEINIKIDWLNNQNDIHKHLIISLR